MAKRVLWLFNHTSLRKFEVPMLIEMGYEVYCPKQWQHLDFSSSVTYEYDCTLTIPNDVIDELNNVDFYKSISREIMEVINKYFDIVFVGIAKGYTESVETLKSFTKSFKGAIGLRALGLTRDVNYTELLGNSCLSLCKSCSDRFWFLPGIESICERECEFLKNRCLYLPYTSSQYEKYNWIGDNEKILCIIPNIKIDEDAKIKYKYLCNNYKDINFEVGGIQCQPLSGENNIMISNKDTVYNVMHAAGLYYLDYKDNFIDFCFFDALMNNVPIIYDGGSILDELGGKDLLGRADSVKDARRKMKKILSGDNGFVKDIVRSQELLKKRFSLSYCRKYWNSAMSEINKSIPKRDDTGDFILHVKKRIAIIMPMEYTGGVLDYSVRLALSLKKSFLKHHDSVEIVFAYPESEIYKKKRYFYELENAKIPLRSFYVKKRDFAWCSRVRKLAGYEPPNGINNKYIEYAVVHDGIADFQDCDYIIFTADTCAILAPIFSIIPFAVVVHDYIQRYVPKSVPLEVSNIKLENQRNACDVIVTSLPTKNDCKQFALLKDNKITLTPLLLELMPKGDNKTNSNDKYFLWSTNCAYHKNHICALHALELYYQNGGTLDCIITGSNTKFLKPNMLLDKAPVDRDYVRRIQDVIEGSSYLREHLHFCGDMPKNSYLNLLSNAKFVFHLGYGDNGNGTVMDAASYGVPSLSSDYPAMRYLADFMGFPLHYVSPFDSEAVAIALQDMEDHYEKYAADLPNREQLEMHDYRQQAEALYYCVKEIVGF